VYVIPFTCFSCPWCYSSCVSGPLVYALSSVVHLLLLPRGSVEGCELVVVGK